MTDLDRRFNEAYKIASETKSKLPADVMLEFYAYYKQATEGDAGTEEEVMTKGVRNAFKFNAWLQLKTISKEEAKIGYINLVEKYITKIK
ncbi:acyl-CoA-binding protein [Aureivirga sp. CE67]|uniref:acyl-CoA-binding protein n=1 Tax=Aureivirga sp. CE67 TaxID=1788983 RepID=UPI0018C9203D|nr:acyl-CoA-binding protein [Aureivirga sp. CE67]